MIQNFLDRIFNQFRAARIETLKEEEFVNNIFDSMKEMDWVLPDLENEPPSGIPPDEKTGEQNAKKEPTETYKQRGFSIAISRDTTCTAEEKLNQFLEWMRQLEETDLAALNTMVGNYQYPYLQKFKFHDSIIEQVKRKLDDYHGSFDGLFEERKKIEELKAEVIQSKKEIEKVIALEKKGLLSKWITEAGERIRQILTSNHELLKQKQQIAREVYAANETRNQALIVELIKTRDIFESQLHDLTLLKGNVAKEQSGKRSNKFLIRSGYLLSITAGLFFSVFSFNASFSSQDMASIILKGLFNSAHQPGESSLLKITQLLEIFGIITLASLLCRSAMVHIRKRQLSDRKEEQDVHFLELKIKNDTIHYSGIFKANNWPLFWFKIMPLLLLTGTVLILISGEKLEGLSDSMTGLTIGSLLSLGLAAFVYVYIVKIIEPRLQRRKNREEHDIGRRRLNVKWLQHWELTATLFFFLMTTLFNIWYMGFSIHTPDLHHLDYRITSLLWFLSTTLCCAFVMAYGMRFQSLSELEDELFTKKLSYDDLIDQLKGVIRSDNNHLLNHQADILMQKLMELLHRRNDVIFRNGEKVRVSETRTTFREDKVKSFIDHFFNRLGNISKQVLHFFENIFFPSEIPPQDRQYSFNEREVNMEMIKWEEEYFAEHYHLLSVHDQELKRYTDELAVIDRKITGFDNTETEPVVTLMNSMTKSVKDQADCNRMILSGNQLIIICTSRIQAKYRLAADKVKKGYELGIWFKNDDPDFNI